MIGIALAVFLGISHAADLLPRTIKSEEVGLSNEHLASVTHAHVESGQVPGAVLVIAHYGQLAYIRELQLPRLHRMVPAADSIKAAGSPSCQMQGPAPQPP